MGNSPGRLCCLGLHSMPACHTSTPYLPWCRGRLVNNDRPTRLERLHQCDGRLWTCMRREDGWHGCLCRCDFLLVDNMACVASCQCCGCCLPTVAEVQGCVVVLQELTIRVSPACLLGWQKSSKSRQEISSRAPSRKMGPSPAGVRPGL